MKNQITAMILAAAMILSVFTGCAAAGAGNGTTVPTTVATTAPEGTTLAGKEQTTAPDPTKETVNTTSPEETTALEETTAPEATTAPDDKTDEPAPSTESTNTQKETEAATTEPPTTQTPTTEPPATTEATEPPHEHSYTAVDTVAPGCASDGYTVYQCSCGSNYTDDEVSATGHSWSDWSITKEATSSAEGEKARTCSACGATETAAIEKLPAEPIDTAALAEYGRQYGKSAYGFRPEIGTRAGYYPGWTVYIDSMEKGRAEVAACVDATADQLIAAGKPIVLVVDGVEYPFLLDVEVVHEGGNQYCVWVYYG